jgi:hypothetical protein
MHCSRILRYAVALVLLFGGLAQADDIVTSWDSVHLPPSPPLTSVTVDPARTALLVLDFDAATDLFRLVTEGRRIARRCAPAPDDGRL